jgi:3-dehydroquinate synthase
MKINLIEAAYPVAIGSGEIEVYFKKLSSENNQNITIIDEKIYSSVIELAPSILLQNDNNIIKINAGKESKTVLTLVSILEKFEAINLSRSGTVVALGGGVIGDIAGLAASLWYRGCNLVHIPSTLLSAVDSCVGGKTAINFGKTINAIGSYYHPSKIIIDTELLQKLPAREWSSGMAEVIKYTVLGNDKLSDIIAKLDIDAVAQGKSLTEIISLSLSQKAHYVCGDIKESSKRLFLNLGHTMGHAFEINTVINGSEKLRHGEGVALGLMAVSHIAYKLNKLEQQGLNSISNLLKKYDLPIDMAPQEEFGIPSDLFIKDCVKSTFSDKKRTKSHLRLILPTGNGNSCEIYETDSRELIKFGIESVLRGRP